MASESKTWAGAGAFMSNLVPALSLFIIGYPLGRATVRTMLIGWFLIIVALTKFVLSRFFQRAESTMTVRTGTTVCSDSGRYR
jgi:flagellar biosynthesis protein FliR